MRKPTESAALVIATLTFAGCVDDPTLDDQVSELAVPACAAGSWCVEATPAGATTLHDVWAADANNVFAVGDAGTILRRSNGEWLAMDSGTTASLRDVHGTSATDVWAVGQAGAVVHYNGTAWSPVPVGTGTANFECVYAASASQIFVCGGSSVWRSTNGGASFAATGMTGSLFAIAGVSATEVYVTGENSYVRKWNGSTWSTINPGAGTSTYFSIAAVGAGDVWVSDFMPSKETMHLASTKWAAKATSAAVFQGMSKGNGSDLWGAGGSKVGRFNGSTWTITAPFGTAASLWSVATTTGHVWTVGANGLVGHFAY